MTRPALCEAVEEPHALNWLTDDFCYCPGCDLLYTRQPGVLVWVYDPWAIALAGALMAAQTRLLALDLGFPHAEPLPTPLPLDDDL